MIDLHAPDLSGSLRQQIFAFSFWTLEDLWVKQAVSPGYSDSFGWRTSSVFGDCTRVHNRLAA
jgi:hypothetical protein